MSTSTEYRHFQVESIQDVCVVRLTTERLGSTMDIHSASNELSQLAETEHNLLIDFSAVTHVSSMMLGNLVDLYNQILEVGGKLVFCSLQKKVYQVLALTKLTKVFEVKKNQREGLAAF